jgi:hypothetical protein
MTKPKSEYTAVRFFKTELEGKKCNSNEVMIAVRMAM